MAPEPSAFSVSALAGGHRLVYTTSIIVYKIVFYD